MPARRVPLIWSSPKEKVQTNLKFNPATSRLENIVFSYAYSNPIKVVEAIYYYNFTGNTLPGNGYALVVLSGTKLRINNFDSANTNQSVFLNTLSSASTITYTSIANPSNYITFSVTSSSNQVSYWEYNITLIASNGSLSPPELIKITYTV